MSSTRFKFGILCYRKQKDKGSKLVSTNPFKVYYFIIFDNKEKKTMYCYDLYRLKPGIIKVIDFL